MRGTEEQFQQVLAELANAIRQFEGGKLRFHQYSQAVDQIFASYNWNKDEFYSELNKLRGIQTHTYALKKVVKTRTTRKKKPIEVG